MKNRQVHRLMETAEVLTNGNQSSDTPLKRWSLILFPLNMGSPYLFASNKYITEEVLLLDFQDKVMMEDNRVGVWISLSWDSHYGALTHHDYPTTVRMERLHGEHRKRKMPK